jgi:hypothetical protein
MFAVQTTFFHTFGLLQVDPENIQLGPTRTWGQGSMSQRLSRKEDTMPDVRNKFSMLNSHDGHQVAFCI